MAIPPLTNLPGAVSLRERTDRDREHLIALFTETTGHQFSALPEPSRSRILAMQFQAREQGWRSQHPEADFHIIEHQGEPAGYWILANQDDAILIVYLGLLRKFQGLGIAAALVRSLASIADRQDRILRAHVESGNPALALWQHMGFRVTGSNDVHIAIESSPRHKA